MRKLHLAAALAAALTLSNPASAGFFDLTLAPYVGLGAGKTSWDLDCSGFTTCDDSDSGWKVYGGLEVNEYISMEVGYADFGKVGATAGANNISAEVNGMTLQLVGTYQFNPSFTLFAKGGFGILHTDVKSNVLASNVEDTDLEWSLGLGAQYNFNKSVGLRLEWERYLEVGGEDPTSTGESDIDLISAGLVIKFDLF